MMTATVAGPYEHVGRPFGGGFFDTTGTPPNFCDKCEHAPCIAGQCGACSMRPRSIVAIRIRQDIFALLDQSRFEGPLRRPLQSAVYALTDAAREAGYPGEWPMRDLASLRTELRELVES